MQLDEVEFATLRRLKNRLPLLQELRLHIFRNPTLYGNASFVPLGDVFASAPLLTHIDLESFPRILWDFNWSSLTSIKLAYPDAIGIVTSALPQTINLEELTIDAAFPDNELVGIGIIRLPHLRYLFLGGVSLLPFLETPALKELCIIFQLEVAANTNSPELALANSYEWGITTGFILRSKCELSSFTATDIGSMALKEVLAYMPDIEQLHLTSIRGWANIFEWLSGTESRANTAQQREPRLRRLDKLAIAFWTLKDSDLVALQNMIAHRTISILGPKILRIEALDDYSWDTVDTRSPTMLEKLALLCKDKGVEFIFAS